MDDISAINRPLTLRELSVLLGTTVARLERLLDRHRIPPTCWIAGARVYAPKQSRRIAAILDEEAAPSA